MWKILILQSILVLGAFSSLRTIGNTSFNVGTCCKVKLPSHSLGGAANHEVPRGTACCIIYITDILLLSPHVATTCPPLLFHCWSMSPALDRNSVSSVNLELAVSERAMKGVLHRLHRHRPHSVTVFSYSRHCARVCVRVARQYGMLPLCPLNGIAPMPAQR